MANGSRDILGRRERRGGKRREWRGGEGKGREEREREGKGAKGRGETGREGREGRGKMEQLRYLWSTSTAR